MTVAGIIAEYNPFHQGHAWHIAQTRAAGASHVVVVMSGCTVQRGEFAIAQTSVRARVALEQGADLVIMLPTPWSCSRAQSFARAGVHLLHSLGCVDVLSFGSESADLQLIQRAATLLKREDVISVMRQAIGEGAAFARARQGAVAQADPQAAALLRSPNDTLAIEYLSAIAHLGAPFKPLAIARKGAGHDEIGGKGYRSASELRITLRSTDFDKIELCEVPGLQYLEKENANGRMPVDMQRLERAWLACLRTMQPNDFACLPDISEGMEHLLWRAIRQENSVYDILKTATSKRYPTARVRRVLFHALLGASAKDFEALPCFINVIGFNNRGRKLLHCAKVNAVLPIITRYADMRKLPELTRQQYKLECRAADLMVLAMPEVQLCGMEEKRQTISI